MPSPFERHSRPDEWSGQPSRSQLRRAAAEDDAGTNGSIDSTGVVGKRAPGKKDKSLCKAAHWKGPHQPEIVLANETWEDQFRSCCRWGPIWSGEDHAAVVRWRCAHEVHCAGCGRIMEYRIPKEKCPTYPGTEEQRAVAQQQAFEWNEERRSSKWRPRRKPIITGPQGYRKKKSKNVGG